MNRAFVIAAFGERSRQVRRLIKNIRSYSDLPIHIITTKDSAVKPFTNYLKETSHFPQVPIDDKMYYDIYIEYVERQWPKGAYREGIRNSNYHKINFALEHHYHSLCMLDDDMYIVGPDFKDGFDIAERFGVALPINPRVYNYFNMMGADVRNEDIEEINTSKIPATIPAVNFSPFFVYPHAGLTTNFLSELRNQLMIVPCRGTVAIIKAMWKTGFTPVILPEQWCVCGSNAQHIKDYAKILQGKTVNIPPIMLHLGHQKVVEVFKIVKMIGAD